MADRFWGYVILLHNITALGFLLLFIKDGIFRRVLGVKSFKITRLFKPASHLAALYMYYAAALLIHSQKKSASRHYEIERLLNDCSHQNHQKSNCDNRTAMWSPYSAVSSALKNNSNNKPLNPSSEWFED